MSAADRIIGRALKHTLWDVHDHLGLLIIANLLAVLLCLPVVTIPLAFAGVFHVTHRVVSEEDVRLADFFTGIARLWKRFALVVAIQAVVVVFCVVNVWFYLSVRKGFTVLGMLAAGICFWFTVSFLLGQLYVGPLACRTELPIRNAYALGYHLLVRHIGSTLIAALYLGALLAILVLTGVGILLLGLIIPALLAHNLALCAAQTSGVSQAARNEEKRTFRDILRPWDM